MVRLPRSGCSPSACWSADLVDEVEWACVDKAGVAARGFHLAVNEGEDEREKAEIYVEAGGERLKSFVVGGDVRGRGGPMGYEDRRM